MRFTISTGKDKSNMQGVFAEQEQTARDLYARSLGHGDRNEAAYVARLGLAQSDINVEPLQKFFVGIKGQKNMRRLQTEENSEIAMLAYAQGWGFREAQDMETYYGAKISARLLATA